MTIQLQFPLYISFFTDCHCNVDVEQLLHDTINVNLKFLTKSLKQSTSPFYIRFLVLQKTRSQKQFSHELAFDFDWCNMPLIPKPEQGRSQLFDFL